MSRSDLSDVGSAGSHVGNHAVNAYLALGSNLGDRQAMLASALREIDETPGIVVIRASEAIETEPVGPPGQGPYLNAAVVVRTTLSARALLEACLRIERSHGRDRSTHQPWGPRTLDIDLLLYGDLVIDEPGLHVPHPRLHERSFVLMPLAEIAPQVVHPVLRTSIKDLLLRLLSQAAYDTSAQPASSSAPALPHVEI